MPEFFEETTELIEQIKTSQELRETIPIEPYKDNSPEIQAQQNEVAQQSKLRLVRSPERSVKGKKRVLDKENSQSPKKNLGDSASPPLKKKGLRRNLLTDFENVALVEQTTNIININEDLF
jgi:hypothetical protein